MQILVSAGPTREYMDPVRFISNRSSGKMGYAVASAAKSRGHKVILVSGPVSIPPPDGVELIKVVSAEEMRTAILDNTETSDALVMAAAVCDMRPAIAHGHKVKKSAMPNVLELEQTADILAEAALLKGKRIYVGFAAETGNPAAEAVRKLKAKNLDMIVGNDVSSPDSGFDSNDNRVCFFFKDGSSREFPLMPKKEVAEHIVEWIENPE